MRILVTGGSGFLGSHVIPLLVAHGHEVVALSRTEVRAPGARWIAAGLEDKEQVAAAVEGIDALYHLAGLVSFRPSEARAMYGLHVDRTRELLRAVRDTGRRPRIVLASTSGTIAVSRTPEVRDEDCDYPLEVIGRWPYYLSKVYQEKLALEFCRRHELPLVVLNPSLLLGPGDTRLSSTWTVLKLLNQELPSLPNGGISFVDVRDAAATFVEALSRGEPGQRYLMGVNMTMREYFERLSRMSGVPMPRLRLPKPLNILGAKVLDRVARSLDREPPLDPQEAEIGEHFFYLDAARAERALGFKARDVHETLFDTYRDLLSRMPPSHLPGTAGRLRSERNTQVR